MTYYNFKKKKAKKYKTEKFGIATISEIAFFLGIHKETLRKEVNSIGINKAIEKFSSREKAAPMVMYLGELITITEASRITGSLCQTIYKSVFMKKRTLDDYLKVIRSRKPSCGSVNSTYTRINRRSEISKKQEFATCSRRINHK